MPRNHRRSSHALYPLVGMVALVWLAGCSASPADQSVVTIDLPEALPAEPAQPRYEVVVLRDPDSPVATAPDQQSSPGFSF